MINIPCFTDADWLISNFNRTGTFIARDNIANFIQWAKSIGVDPSVTFEADDLVARKNEKNVLLVRMGYR